MSYYNRYRNRRRQDNNGNGNGGAGNNNNGGNLDLSNNGGLQVPDAIFDLGKNKRVTVRQFRNINLIDIREYYLDSSTGEMKPGKKGISLTEDLYDELLKHRLNIDEALRRFGSRRPRTRLVRLLSDDEDDEEDNDDDKEKKDSKKNKKNDADEKGKDGNKDGKNKKESGTRSKNNDGKPEGKDNKRERDYDVNEGNEKKKKKPAPPTLLLHEETIENAKREANATLFLPGMKSGANEEETPSVATNENSADIETGAKKEDDPAPALYDSRVSPTLPPVTSDHAGQNDTSNNNKKSTKPATTDVAAENSSDEEFAESLQAEMDKMLDESSEEE